MGRVLLYQMTPMCLCCCSISSMLVLLGDGPIYLESPLHQRDVIDIDATVEKNPINCARSPQHLQHFVKTL